jgi:Protein of unknown function (DUF4235)
MSRDKQPVEAPPGDGGKSESMAQKLYATAGAMIAATLVRKVVQRGWVKATGKVPPKNPESPDVRWTEAVGWSVLSGTSVAVARLLAKRRAAGAWQRVSTGSTANGLSTDDPKDS